MKEYRMINDPVYCNYPININGSACHGEILDAIHERLNYWLTFGTRVHVTRLDIRFPIGWSVTDNSLLSKFLWGLRMALGGEIFHYVWCSEQDRSPNPHYHLVIFRDGKYKSGYSIMKAAISTWSKLLNHPADGLVHMETPRIPGAYCSLGVQLDKNAPTFLDAYSATFYWLSYLAKGNTKTTATGHSYGASRL